MEEASAILLEDHGYLRDTCTGPMDLGSLALCIGMYQASTTHVICLWNRPLVRCSRWCSFSFDHVSFSPDELSMQSMHPFVYQLGCHSRSSLGDLVSCQTAWTFLTITMCSSQKVESIFILHLLWAVNKCWHSQAKQGISCCSLSGDDVCISTATSRWGTIHSEWICNFRLMCTASSTCVRLFLVSVCVHMIQWKSGVLASRNLESWFTELFPWLCFAWKGSH